ncbi:hypothetical protein D9757_006039 [Collybiopsis confluens]|uniref:Uncharacterized protein n=1 Tax=Collybiopsis confluens TaxID=2823264 RepID=A0A8H5MDK5_9AGAR|nr:hypothetical protein D9757_006039 [Collybiopsis confluens]
MNFLSTRELKKVHHSTNWTAGSPNEKWEQPTTTNDQRSDQPVLASFKTVEPALPLFPNVVGGLLARPPTFWNGTVGRIVPMNRKIDVLYHDATFKKYKHMSEY